MPTQRCTPHDRTTPPVVSSCPLSSTMWKNVIVSNASVPWKVSHLTQSLCLLFKCFTTTGALLWSYHVQTLQFRDSEMVSLTYGPIRCGWMLICFDQISRVRSDCFSFLFPTLESSVVVDILLFKAFMPVTLTATYYAETVQPKVIKTSTSE